MSSTGYVIIGIFFLFLIIVGIVVWVNDGFGFFNNDDPEEEIIYAKINLFARDTESNLISVNYEVMDNSSRTIQRGFLKKGVVEQFKDLKEERTYILKASGNGYYENTQECLPTQESCTVILERIAKIYLRTVKIKDDYSVGLLYLEDGKLDDPIICSKWQNLISFSINMTEINVPVEYYNEYDKCYAFNQNLTESLYQFNINHKITDEQPNEFQLDLIDKCNNRYVREDCAKTIIVKEII